MQLAGGDDQIKLLAVTSKLVWSGSLTVPPHPSIKVN